jgi:5-methylcytosine-specific restriction endonuclease McrA
MAQRTCKVEDIYPKLERLPDGKRPCRYCKLPTAGAMWHADCCDLAYFEAGHSYMRRRLIEKRDKHVCQLCGLNLEDLTEAIRWYRRWRAKQVGRDPWDWQQHLDPSVKDLCRAIGPAAYNWEKGKSLEEHDHIIPLSEGGSNKLENFRTLCRKCHLQVTKELRKRLAASKKSVQTHSEAPLGD